MAGDAYLRFLGNRLPIGRSLNTEPEAAGKVCCDSPASGQETVKKQPPGEAVEEQVFSFFLSTCQGLGRDCRYMGMAGF